MWEKSSKEEKGRGVRGTGQRKTRRSPTEIKIEEPEEKRERSMTEPRTRSKRDKMEKRGIRPRCHTYHDGGARQHPLLRAPHRVAFCTRDTIPHTDSQCS